MCHFISQSDVGRRILKICSVGTNCQVMGTVVNDQDAGDWSPINTDIIKIEKSSELDFALRTSVASCDFGKVIHKTCPAKNCIGFDENVYSRTTG